jgi:hypothetical protein
MAQSWSKGHPSESLSSILGVIGVGGVIPAILCLNFLLNVKPFRTSVLTESLSNCYQNVLDLTCFCYTYRLVLLYKVKERTKQMKAARLKTTEVQEAAQAFIASGFNADDMRPLMNLMSWQTSYIQKRFWKIVDLAKEQSN